MCLDNRWASITSSSRKTTMYLYLGNVVGKKALIQLRWMQSISPLLPWINNPKKENKLQEQDKFQWKKEKEINKLQVHKSSLSWNLHLKKLNNTEGKLKKM